MSLVRMRLSPRTIVVLASVLLIAARLTTVHGQLSLSTSAQTQAITLAKVLDPCPNPVLPNFKLVEATIDDIHKAFMDGTLTCTSLVKAYMQRNTHIDQYLGINSLERFNPTVLTLAKAMDAQLMQYRRGNGAMPPLFCVPISFKANYDVKGMPTTAGATVLEDNFPPEDATMVAQVKAAGAVVLGKLVMSEWAFSGTDSIDSVSGMTRNPYDITRVAGGSSGGTGTAINANMAMVGFGTDTGGSIRNPAAVNALVGWRPSLGITSRAGIVPLRLNRDTGGPLGRTVTDVAKVANAIALGPTPPDARDKLSTFAAANNVDLPLNYTAMLDTAGLNGTRVGVFDELLYKANSDSRYIETFEATLKVMEELGATIVRNFTLSPSYKITYSGTEKNRNDFGVLTNNSAGSSGTNRWLIDGAYENLNSCYVFPLDLQAYLDGSTGKIKTVDAVITSQLYHPNSYRSLSAAANINFTRDSFYSSAPAYTSYKCNTCGEFYESNCRSALRALITERMDKDNLDTYVFPTYVRPPIIVDDPDADSGSTDTTISPQSGNPALTIPIGYIDERAYGGISVKLPVAMQFNGKGFADAYLIKYAYALEQKLKIRITPPTTPECGAGMKTSRSTRQMMEAHLAHLGFAPQSLSTNSNVDDGME